MNFESDAQRQIEIAVNRLEENEMLQFASGIYRVYRYIDTGETNLRTIKVGESEHVFRVPVKEPYLVQEANTISELSLGSEYPLPLSDKEDFIDHPDYQKWLKSLVSPDDLLNAAQDVLSSRELEGESETIACTNCKGKAQFNVPCSCTQGGTTFYDLVVKDEPTQLRETGVANPDCSRCKGTGSHTNDCLGCNGLGLSAKYPEVILTNEMTGEQRTLVLDMAKLIVANEVEVEWTTNEQSYSNGYQIATGALKFNLSDYFNKSLAELGIDTKLASVVRDTDMFELNTKREDIFTERFHWQNRNGKITKRLNDSTNKTPADVLENAQHQIVRNNAWGSNLINDTNGIRNVTELVIRPLRPLMETYADIRTVLESQGYSLGVTQSFIATGEVGPALFILDSDGHAMQQLSVAYSFRDALENAWLQLEYMRTNSPDREI